MQKVIVCTRSSAQAYRVMLGVNVEKVAEIAEQLKASKAALVCSKNTVQIAGRIAKAMESKSMESCIIQIQDEEENKNLNTVETIFERLYKERIDRDGVIVAVGGGVVGDVAGFAAATYLRGVSLVQVPTTLLAMADSSVGGKTGVNFFGKNLVGAFHQPKAVVIDFSTLRSLPREELRQGFAEIVKTACIQSPTLFDFLEQNAEKAVELDEGVLATALKEVLKIKAGIVARDERESRSLKTTASSRMLLNFGHSVGHAIETASGHAIRHGDAVSVGISAECLVSNKLGLISLEEFKRVRRLLQKFGLSADAKGMNAQRVVELMKLDKKNSEGKLVLVLLNSIGAPTIVEGVAEETILDALRELGAK